MQSAPHDLSAQDRRRGIWAVLLLSFPAGASYALVTPLMTVAMEARGHDALAIGALAAVFPLAIMTVGPFVPLLVGRFGTARTLLLSVLASAAAVSVLPQFDGIVAWFLLRYVVGAAIAIVWIASETWLNVVAPPERRGLLLGAYASVLASGIAAGPAVIALFGTEGRGAYLAGAGILLLVALPLLWAWRAVPVLPGQSPASVLRVAGVAPLTMLVGLCAGFAETAIFGLLPVWALRQGMGPPSDLLLLSAFAVGNVALQVPFGRLLDRIEGRGVAAAVGVLAALFALLLAASVGTWLVWPAIVLLGGATYAFYTVGLTLLGRRFPATQMAGANTAFVIAYTAGGVAGPTAAGWAMETAGPHGLLWTVALASAALGGGAMVARLQRR
ncbi:MAG: MFS transporter [Alphaproteobacteria bacterium]|nr:MFS transporter [Alphaproteobacteria bacterium]